jgi:hypothetical protein
MHLLSSFWKDFQPSKHTGARESKCHVSLCCYFIGYKSPSFFEELGYSVMRSTDGSCATDRFSVFKV